MSLFYKELRHWIDKSVVKNDDYTEHHIGFMTKITRHEIQKAKNVPGIGSYFKSQVAEVDNLVLNIA